MLSRGELHKLIREKGGAYGSGVKFNALSGSFSFYSYRDPHVQETIENFQKAFTLISEGKFEYTKVI